MPWICLSNLSHRYLSCMIALCLLAHNLRLPFIVLPWHDRWSNIQECSNISTFMVDSQALIGRPAGIFDLNIDDNLEYSMGKFVFETWTKTAFESYWFNMQEHTICVKHSNIKGIFWFQKSVCKVGLFWIQHNAWPQESSRSEYWLTGSFLNSDNCSWT